ncbi:ABC transporter substrate-binding protein [Thioclava sp. BHET1]|nr:ABC transporter substrate-binding protein [Thioclava sp. BHET1]
MNAKTLFRALALLCLTLAAQPLAAQTILRVYSATDTDAIAAVVEAFEAGHPDIHVAYTEFQTSDLYDRMLSGDKTADVVISSAMDLQTDLVNRGMARPFQPSGADSLPDWAKWRGELYGFTFEPVVMAFSRKAYAGRQLPRNRSQLASMIRDDPAFYDGRVGTYDLTASGVGYLFANQDAQRGYQFPRLIESFGRAHARSYCCTSEMLEDIASGKLVFAYNLIGSYALRAAARNPKIGLTLFEDYTLVMSRTVFIPHAAPHPEQAAAFASFLLSPAGQKAIADHSALMPISDYGTAPRMRGLLETSNALLPIRLGPGLLAYLDRYKRRRFLADWRASMALPPRQ